MKGYKGFGPGMICKGYGDNGEYRKEYKEDTTYEEPNAVICQSGMHFCENPLDVLDYYPLLNDDTELNEFAEVEALADVHTNDNKKYCTTKLHVGAKLDLKGFIKASVDFMMEKANKLAASGNYSQLAASGDYSKLAASGDSSKLAASGDSSQLAASGDSSQLAASGNSSKLAANGKYSIAAGIGINNIAKAAEGCWIVLAEWEYRDDNYIPKMVKAAQVDGEKIKPDTWYELDNGEFTEV